MIAASTVVDRARKTVWDYIMVADNWRKWWGGALRDVVPDWESGAKMIWETGGASDLADFKAERCLEMEGHWSNTRISVSPVGERSTLVEISEGMPKNGAVYSDGGAAQKKAHEKVLGLLKSRIEAETEAGEVNGPSAAEGDPGGDAELRAMIMGLLQQHIERMCSLFSSNPALEDMPSLAEELISSENAEYALSTIARGLPAALRGMELVSDSRVFVDWVVGITVCPWLDPNEGRSRMPGGYLAQLERLTTFDDFARKGKHGAHWIFCTDGQRTGVHLTLVPNPNRKTLRAQPVLAIDFLTDQERRAIGMA
jgi:hypothetical protein